MSEVRCAYCHDQLSPPAGLSCGACGSRLHPACAHELGRCPTLGCATRAWPRCAARDRPLTPAARGLISLGGLLARWLS